MARVPYIVNDTLGTLCSTLNIANEYYTILGGHYAFENADTHQLAMDKVYDYIFSMLEDDNDSNDELAYSYKDIVDGSDYQPMYWSTEGKNWF